MISISHSLKAIFQPGLELTSLCAEEVSESGKSVTFLFRLLSFFPLLIC